MSAKKQLRYNQLVSVAIVGLSCQFSAHPQPNTLPEAVKSSLVKKYGAEGTRFFSAATDLNGDGSLEIVVYIVSRNECGTGGCPTLVFTPQGSGYRLVSTLSVTRPPIRLSPRSANGWKSLIVGIAGGGAKAANAELAFNGKAYPSNPTVPPARRVSDLAGTSVLIDEYDSFDKAIPLASATATGVTHTAGAPSFDCAKATAPAEKLICSDAGLAAKDRKLAEVYGLGIKRWASDGVASEQRTNQRKWIAARNRCGTSKDCIDDSYTRRIVEVQIQSGQLMAPKPFSYKCTGKSGVPFTVAYYNQTEPRSAVITSGDSQVIALVAPAGSGAKYVAPNVEFWEHHGEAAVKWFGASLTCKVLQ